MKLRELVVLAMALALGGCKQEDAPPAAVDGAAVDGGADARASAAMVPDATTATDGASADGGNGADGAIGVDCMPATHPGTVTFVDQDTGITTVDDASTVPDSIKWHDTSTGRVPVVKVVKHRLTDGTVELTLYGPCGQLLEVVHGMG